MRFNPFTNFRLLGLLIITLSAVSHRIYADVNNDVHQNIYKHIDANGDVHFSDRPLKDYSIGGYQEQSGYGEQGTVSVDLKRLELIAKQLKRYRLQREKKRKKDDKAVLQKYQKQQQRLIAKKNKQKACDLASAKEDAAFRKRSKGRNLKQMESALANYEKKREIRKLKCG